MQTYPVTPCFPDEVSAMQISAIVFGLAYLIGIPFFFYRLINHGVHQMIDIQGVRCALVDLHASLVPLSDCQG